VTGEFPAALIETEVEWKHFLSGTNPGGQIAIGRAETRCRQIVS
jgi:hypothetical protein